jgi:hypothetical protein
MQTTSVPVTSADHDANGALLEATTSTTVAQTETKRFARLTATNRSERS